MSIRSKIQSLITAANATTGESDTTLTDAVQTLIDGYGQGGGEVISLPSEYQRVEYISKTNSSGAYINTGYVPELNTDVYVKASIDGKRDQKFFGGFGTGSGNGAGFALAQVGDNWRVTIGVGWTAIGTAVVDAPTDFVIELRAAKFFVWIDNQMLFLATDKELYYPLYIFATNYNNSVSSGFGGNIYRVTVRRGETVLRDYIPCYRKADGVIGMYEIMTETFLTNAGSGSFGKGADV